MTTSSDRGNAGHCRRGARTGCGGKGRTAHMTGQLSTAGRALADRRGLRESQAQERLTREGPNTLPTPRMVPGWRQLVAQLVHFFALMLWVAGGLAFVAGMPQLGVAIFVVS